MKLKLKIAIITIIAAGIAIAAGIKCNNCKGTGWSGSFKCTPCGGDGEL